jgi:hypothetical protein
MLKDYYRLQVSVMILLMIQAVSCVETNDEIINGEIVNDDIIISCDIAFVEQFDRKTESELRVLIGNETTEFARDTLFENLNCYLNSSNTDLSQKANTAIVLKLVCASSKLSQEDKCVLADVLLKYLHGDDQRGGGLESATVEFEISEKLFDICDDFMATPLNRGNHVVAIEDLEKFISTNC